MRKIAVCVVVGLVMSGTAGAEDLRTGEGLESLRRQPAARVSGSHAGTVRLAEARVPVAQAPGQSQRSPESKNWFQRHPILAGLVIGTAAGAATYGGACASTGNYGDVPCSVYAAGGAAMGAGIGTGVGALISLLK